MPRGKLYQEGSSARMGAMSGQYVNQGESYVWGIGKPGESMPGGDVYQGEICQKES